MEGNVSEGGKKKKDLHVEIEDGKAIFSVQFIAYSLMIFHL